MREIVIIRANILHPRYFLIPCAPVEIHRLADFRVLWLKRCVSVTATSFLGCEQNLLIIFTIFSQKREIPCYRNVKIPSAITPVL